MAGQNTGVVLAAMVANGAIAVLKFFGYLLTGSPSMLAETYHSISDTGNQVLLLIGIKYSERGPTQIHPYGYGKAQFFFAFLVSVLLFGVAGWESLNHGISELRSGGHGGEAGQAEILGFSIDIALPVEPFWVAVAILIGAIMFESYAFWKARAELKRQMDEYDWSGYREAFSQSSDITTLTAFTEDTIALLGLVVALAGQGLARATGNSAYDAVGAIVIGVLLMTFALLLAVENKRLILGESLPVNIETKLQTAVSNHESVVTVDDFRTMFIGTGRVLVTADVSFDSGIDTADIEDDIQQIESALEGIDDRVKLVYIVPSN